MNISKATIKKSLNRQLVDKNPEYELFVDAKEEIEKYNRKRQQNKTKTTLQTTMDMLAGLYDMKKDTLSSDFYQRHWPQMSGLDSMYSAYKFYDILDCKTVDIGNDYYQIYKEIFTSIDKILKIIIEKGMKDHDEDKG